MFHQKMKIILKKQDLDQMLLQALQLAQLSMSSSLRSFQKPKLLVALANRWAIIIGSFQKRISRNLKNAFFFENGTLLLIFVDIFSFDFFLNTAENLYRRIRQIHF